MWTFKKYPIFVPLLIVHQSLGPTNLRHSQFVGKDYWRNIPRRIFLWVRTIGHWTRTCIHPNFWDICNPWNSRENEIGCCWTQWRDSGRWANATKPVLIHNFDSIVGVHDINEEKSCSNNNIGAFEKDDSFPFIAFARKSTKSARNIAEEAGS